MQFENEPEGWDDHIVHNPPVDKDQETRDEYQSGLILGALIVVTAVGGLAVSALIAYAVFM